MPWLFCSDTESRSQMLRAKLNLSRLFPSFQHRSPYRMAFTVELPVCRGCQCSPWRLAAEGRNGCTVSQSRLPRSRISASNRSSSGRPSWSKTPIRALPLSSVHSGHGYLQRRSRLGTRPKKKSSKKDVVCCSLEDNEDPVVSTAWLEKNLEGVSILDIRGHTVSHVVEDGVGNSEYKSDYDEYLEGHVPGAVFFDWIRDGLDQQASAPVQLMDDSEEFAAVMEGKGVSTEKPVVVYDRGDGLLAPRLWWALVRHGHPCVRILDGGLKKWADEGRPVELYEPCTLKVYADFTPAMVHPSLVTSWETLLPHVLRMKDGRSTMESEETQRVVIVDARDTAQYNGSIRRSKHAGRVPGAISIPRRNLLEPGGTFKSVELQRQVFLEAGVDPSLPTTLIAYCNGGVASCTVLLAWHRIQGSGEWSNYDGSWNEWGNRDDLPVEV